jgi:hypothetical protein
VTPEEFSKKLYEMFVTDAVESYEEMYSRVMESSDTDLYSSDIKKVLASFDDDGKKAFFRLLRVVCSDSADSFCALLDGSAGFIGQTSNFVLLTEDQKDEQINGELLAHIGNVSDV